MKNLKNKNNKDFQAKFFKVYKHKTLNKVENNNYNKVDNNPLTLIDNNNLKSILVCLLLEEIINRSSFDMFNTINTNHKL